MSKQSEMDLETRSMAHHDDPETSYMAAAQHVQSGNAITNRQTVLFAVTRWPGRTGAELAANMVAADLLPALNVFEVRRRLSDLKRRGEVVHGVVLTCRVAGTLAVTWEAKT